LQLAEAMTARGFASEGAGDDGVGPDSRTRLVILLGLALLLGGWLLRLVWGLSAVGLSLMLLGVGLVVAALWWIGRRAPRTSYRPPTWSAQAGLTVAGALVAALGFGLAWPGLDRASIFFYPYPQLTWPGFQPLLGLVLAGLLAPLALRWPAVTPVDQAEPAPRRVQSEP
jgi:energy-coupling factor transport system permease protein